MPTGNSPINWDQIEDGGTLLDGDQIAVRRPLVGNRLVSCPSFSGGAAWGAITGTLADQTDLQTVLDTKGTSNFNGVYSSLTSIPSTFAPIIGSGGTQACAGNDSRLTDSRTPTAHKTSHQDGGADELALDASQITTGQFAVARLASGTPTGSKFVRDDGVLAVPAGGAGASVSQATVSLPYASRSHRQTVTDAGVTPSSKIILSLAGVPDTAVNSPDMVDILSMSGIPGSGSFQFQAEFLTPIGGPLTINYMVG